MSKEFKLIIGNLNYSSWSLCSWLCLKSAGFEFEEEKISLGIKGSRKVIRQFSPSGFVPALIHNNLTISDSLAIAEYINELSNNSLYPKGIKDRAKCRSIISELHSGFVDFRKEVPMNIKKTFPNAQLSFGANKQFERIQEIFEDLLKRDGFLFGEWGMADIFYSQVVIRIVNYNLPCSDTIKKYCNKVLSKNFIQEWIEKAKLEKESIEIIDSLQK
ncbi:MAG: glutathione S-transferase N-terminal domain-containing protein [Rickettsiales bacterium]